MQRVRIGLTGMAFVFLLVLLGSVFRSASEEEPITANSIEQQMQSNQASNQVEAEPKEALAELGVAPGNADSNSNSTGAKPSN
jgi:Tfp pilus assembly protein PilX